MEKLKNKLKNVKGITLISLVVTIIVLIILAGVTLNMIFKENGIINRTKTAKEENEKATASEIMTLKITECQMKAYAENGKLPDLQYLADRFCEDNDIAYVNLEKQKVGAINDKILIGENTSIFTKLEKYPYEFEINSSLQLASIDGIQIAKNNNEQQNPISEVNLNITNIAYNGFKITATSSSTTSIICYVYIVNGELKGSGAENEITIKDLQADTEYNIMVVAIDSEGNSKKSIVKKQKTSSEIIFDKAFLQSGSTFGNVTITENNYNESAGLRIIGRSSEAYSSTQPYKQSDKIRWYKSIDLTKFNNIEFYAKKVENHGSICIYIDDERIFCKTYDELPTDWTSYNVSLNDYTGTHTVGIIGGYPDNSGSTSSQTEICNIKINNN